MRFTFFDSEPSSPLPSEHKTSEVTTPLRTVTFKAKPKDMKQETPQVRPEPLTLTPSTPVEPAKEENKNG